jgi:hypothetical protein
MRDESKTVLAHCNKCLDERHHKILHEEDQPWEQQYAASGIYGSDTFRMLKCCGCDNVSLQKSTWSSEETDENGNGIPYVTYYPPAISRPTPKWLADLEFFRSSDETYIAELLHEIYSALHNDSRRLAVMGVRALLEHVMISSVTDYGTFKKNLENFQVQGYLSAKQRKLIEPILEAGHATIHRGYHPSAEDVNTVVEIAESLIATTFVHAEKVEELDKRIPKKKKKNR